MLPPYKQQVAWHLTEQGSEWRPLLVSRWFILVLLWHIIRDTTYPGPDITDIWVDYRLDVIVPCFWILKYSVYLLFVGGLGHGWWCFINPLSDSRLRGGCCSLGLMVTSESRQRIGRSGSFSALILRWLSGLAFPSRPFGYFFSGACRSGRRLSCDPLGLAPFDGSGGGFFGICIVVLGTSQ